MNKKYDVTIEFINGKKVKYEAKTMSMCVGYATITINDSVIYYIPYSNILTLRTEEAK